MDCVETIGDDEMTLYFFSAVAAILAYMSTLVQA